MEIQKDNIYRDYKIVKYTKLAGSIAVDFMGFASYALIGIGEFGDIAWAPIAATANYLMNGSRTKGILRNKGSWLTAIEEFLPFTDIIPSVSMSWRRKYVKNGNETLRQFIAEKRKEHKILEDEFTKPITVSEIEGTRQLSQQS